MTKEEALLQVQSFVNMPKKDKATNEWVVRYYNGKHWVNKSFITDDGAYVFFYTKLREMKDAIMTMKMKEITNGK